VLLVKLLIESARIWPGQRLFVFKIDLKKAFDRVFLSGVLDALGDLESGHGFGLALARKIVDNKLEPVLAGAVAELVTMLRGLRQGRPESSALFGLTLEKILEKLLYLNQKIVEMLL
jgi:hypothetical protein